MDPLSFIEVLALLVFAHYLADFPLQNDFLAQYKNRHMAFPEKIWVHCLTGHSVIHGGFVGIITGSVLLGVLEAISHWLIDYFKCEKKISFHLDQCLHISFKVLWALIYFHLM